MRALIILLCVSNFSASAQLVKPVIENYSITWSSGGVVFKSGDSVACQVRYNMAAHSILQIKHNDHILTISPSDVKFFTFYDSSKNKLRKFSALPLVPYSPSQDVFLENLYDGSKFSILNHKTYGMPYEYLEYTRFISRPTQISKKYIVDWSTGQLFPMSKENLLRLIDNRKPEITSFIDQHNLKFRKVADYIAILQFHGTL